MSTKPAQTFVPVKFQFKTSSEETRFYIYGIRHLDKDKYYIGISRNPSRRINDQLKSKTELKEDYARAVGSIKENPAKQLPFEFSLSDPQGYPDAFLGCIAEVLYMIALEKHGKQIYNQNKFGGHPSLAHKRRAFEAVVKIIDPALKGHPSEDDMLALEDHIAEIRQHVDATNNEDIINSDTLTLLDRAWDEHLERRRYQGFGRKPTSPLPNIAFGRQGFPLIPVVVANDNQPDTPYALDSDHSGELATAPAP